jgi:hypothetical protein
MTRKNFKSNNPALAFIDTQDVQGAPNAQDVQGVPNAQDVPKKSSRINMAFTPSNLDYLRLISRIEGVSITSYVNNLVQQDKILKKEITEKAKNILNNTKK